MSTPKKSTDGLLQKFTNSSNNPYQFNQFASLVQKQDSQKNSNFSYEDKISREQHLTLFENDESMRNIFKGDFEDYYKAVLNPDLMIKKMEERAGELEKNIQSGMEDISEMSQWWQDEFWSDPFDDMDTDALGVTEAEEEVFGFSGSDLYEKANKWANRLHEISSSIYKENSGKNRNLYRVMINVFLVPTKIMYADIEDEIIFENTEENKPEIEVSLKAYSLAMLFLQRVRESLSVLIEKNFQAKSEWQAAILVADEIALEIQDKMITLTRSLKSTK